MIEEKMRELITKYVKEKRPNFSDETIRAVVDETMHKQASFNREMAKVDYK